MAGDANFANVSLLLHGDGANGSTTITDNSASPKTSTVTGNAAINTAQSKFGGASIFFDGAGDSVAVPPSSDFVFGTGDFTIEMWVYPQNTGSAQCILMIGNSSTYVYLGIDNTVNTPPMFFFNSRIIVGSSGFTLNTWQHVALVRSIGVCTIFLNGVSVGSAAFTIDMTATATVTVGAYPPTLDPFTGYVDDLRITKGLCRYTANFTPSASAFPDRAAQVSGVIRDSTGALCARTVRLFQRNTGALAGSTVSNASTGAYVCNSSTLNEVVRIVHSNTTTAPLENDLIDRVIPN